jgi:hypothetical protein
MSAEGSTLVQRHGFAQRAGQYREMQAPVYRKQAGAEAYECLLDNGRLMQGDTDVCLRSVNIQLYRVIEKECRDYKNLSFKNC